MCRRTAWWARSAISRTHQYRPDNGLFGPERPLVAKVAYDRFRGLSFVPQSRRAVGCGSPSALRSPASLHAYFFRDPAGPRPCPQAPRSRRPYCRRAACSRSAAWSLASHVQILPRRPYLSATTWVRMRRTWSGIAVFPTSLGTAAVQPVLRHSFATCSLTDSIVPRLAMQAEVKVEVIRVGSVRTGSEDRGEITAGRRSQCADQIA